MKTEVMDRRHTSSLLTDHIVLTPKFRARVLTGQVAKDCERLLRDVCLNIDVRVLEMAVAPDHVHLFVQYPPDISPSKIVEKLKSNASRELRARHPELRKWCKSALWAPGSFHGSVGHGFDVVEQYISSQRQFSDH